MTRTGNDLRPAPFFPRAAAYLLDRLIWGVILLVPRAVVFFRSLGGWDPGRAVLFRFTWGDIVLWALGAAYFIVLTACTGSTLGKKAMGLTVVTLEGERPSFLTVLCRETFGRYLSSLLCIGYLLCAMDPDRGALHDRICDTLVVYSLPVRERRLLPAPAPVARTSPEADDWYAPNL